MRAAIALARQAQTAGSRPIAALIVRPAANGEPARVLAACADRMSAGMKVLLEEDDDDDEQEEDY